jgi:hypothetical protein
LAKVCGAAAITTATMANVRQLAQPGSAARLDLFFSPQR